MKKVARPAPRWKWTIRSPAGAGVEDTPIAADSPNAAGAPSGAQAPTASLASQDTQAPTAAVAPVAGDCCLLCALHI